MDKKSGLCKCLKINNIQSPDVPRADITGQVAIVYSWWLLKVLSIRWLYYLAVYPNNERKMRPNAPKNLSMRVGPQFCGPQYCGVNL